LNQPAVTDHSELDIGDEALERLLASDDGGPLVLVNLVRLRPDGREAYDQYMEAVAPLFANVGAELVWASDDPGGTLIGSEAWDVAAVVRYPSRAALAALVRDPAFQATAPLRHAALEAGILHVFR
jgi:uncharacterized protein (DUF1330 family)